MSTKTKARPGPKTQDGKAIAARNSTTHGLFARDVVLPSLGEDPAAYKALLAELTAQLRPANLLERHYVEKIAAASWRLRRLHRWMAQIYEDEQMGEGERLDKLDKVLRHETALHRQIDTAIKMMNKDVPQLHDGRTRRRLLNENGLSETQCRADAEMAAAIERMAQRGAQLPTLPADLDADTLDTARPEPRAVNEPQTTPICENEPAPQSEVTPQNEPRTPQEIAKAWHEGEDFESGETEPPVLAELRKGRPLYDHTRAYQTASRRGRRQTW